LKLFQELGEGEGGERGMMEGEFKCDVRAFVNSTMYLYPVQQKKQKISSRHPELNNGYNPKYI
jgi:hypothetical protein